MLLKRIDNGISFLMKSKQSRNGTSEKCDANAFPLPAYRPNSLINQLQFGYSICALPSSSCCCVQMGRSEC